jgi:hypothetical protein
VPPARNRVTPTGEIVAIPLRGLFLGNRGCLHEGQAIVRRWNSRLWITCALSYKDWRLPQWAPRRFTVLFFHDEPVALAAGHRPCALCRRADYNRFRDAWVAARRVPPPKAHEMDRVLHADRLDRGRQRTHERTWSDLPDGAFVAHDGSPALVAGDNLVPWSHAGYGKPRPRPSTGAATVLTPAITVEVLAAGYRPVIHPQAAGSTS